MGWVSLLLRKQTLRQSINEHQMQKIALSRQLRSYQRQSSFDETVFNNDKSQELRAAKEPLDALRKKRPNVDSDEYKEWQQKYNDAKEKYESEKIDINDYYDGILNELEEEATDEETRITTEQDELQAQLDNMSQELEALSDAISTDIQNTALKFS